MTTDLAKKRSWLGPYAVDFPAFWAEVVPSVSGEKKWLKTVMARNVTFDLVFVPNANGTTVNGFLASMAQSFPDGEAHPFNVSHAGRAFRGMRVSKSHKLGANAFIEAHTYLNGGDLLAFTFGVHGPIEDGTESFPPVEAIDKIRLLLLTVVNGAIAKSGARAQQTAPRGASLNNEVDLDNFPSGDDPF